MIRISDNLLEAARIDGCSEFGIFIKIVLPSVKTAMLSLSIFTFITA
jgi:multiple sugar transport system permease protein